MGSGQGWPGRLDEQMQKELDALAAMPTDVLAGIVLSVFAVGETGGRGWTIADIIMALEDGFRAPYPAVLLAPLAAATSRLADAGLLAVLGGMWYITPAGLDALANDAVAETLV